MYLKSFKSIILLSLAAGCGSSKDSTSGTSKTTTPTSAQLAQDSTAQATVVSSQMEVALNAALGGESGTGANPAALDGIYLAEDLPKGVKSFTKKCTFNANDNSAVVERSGAMEVTHSRAQKKFTVTRTVKGTLNGTRTWRKEGVAIPCNPSGTEAQIPWQSPVGVVMSHEFKKSHSMTLTRTAQGQTLVNVSRESTHEGKGATKWTAATESNGVLTRTKEVSLQTSFSLSKIGKNQDSSFSATQSTPENAPLVVSVTRDTAAPYGLKTQTLEKGTLVASLPNGGGTVSSTFNNLVMTRSGEGDSLTSGSVVLSFADSTGAEVGKVNCTISSADDMSCTDSAGNTVDVDLPTIDITEGL